ncbi:putative geraniol 8-hydroxylase [Helianthus annuus]|uniref:Geraniol 8-hydroxylase n=1 Tax=Helianthus annuus TaxID=4232 RepID=A0A9K3JAM2_HELAN|nr:putative geraniol 8-hydroxylase [Helianthus annuus]KAJ0758949.1 putative geraniol 8-hydroxylase [Helianthus annuus]
MFSAQRLDASETLRQKKVKELLDHVNCYCTSEKAVNIGGMAFTTLVNVLSDFMFSVDFAQYDSLSSQEFKDNVWALMEIAGKPNIVDFFLILKMFDPQGLLRRGNVYGRKIMTIFDRVLFITGTDTLSSTLEWAMVELIHNPSKLEKACFEITKLMENKKNIIQESDIPQLPYLQAVIKETLRLHPRLLFLSLTKP